MRLRKAILLIVAITVITRLPFLWTQFFDVDEVIFSLFVKIWKHGGIPYVNCVETKAMGIYWFYVFASWLAGSLPTVNMLAVHLLTIVWTLLTAWCLARMTTRLASSRAGFFAALFFVVFTTTFHPKIIAANIEVVLLLPLCLSVSALLRPLEQLQLRHSFFSGVMLSAAILCKYQAGIVLPIVLLYFTVLLGRASLAWRWPRALRHASLFLLGGLPLPALMLWHIGKMGGLHDFFFWNYQGNIFYVNSGDEGMSLAYAFGKYAVPFFFATGLLWYFVGERMLLNVKTWRDTATRLSPAEWFLWLWLILTFIPVSLGRRFYGHYFLLLLPPLSVLAAMTLASWSDLRWQRWRKIVIAAILVPLVSFTTARFCMNPIYRLIGSSDNLELLRPYGMYLRERTTPADRILVWGSSPAVYWYADRLPATRFPTIGYISGHVPGMADDDTITAIDERLAMPGAWAMFFADLDHHPPRVIIDMAATGMFTYSKCPLARYPRVMEYIRKYYVEEPRFGNAVVYRRREESVTAQ